MIKNARQQIDAAALAERVLIFAPVGRDSIVLREKLRSSDLLTQTCATMQDLCEGITQGAGTALVAEEVLTPPALELLRRTLQEQPDWSDFPLIIMTSGESQHRVESILGAIEGAAHAVLLERPVRASTLVSAVRVALQSRRRQYQLRDLQRSLELQVVERTAMLEQQADQLRRLALDLTQTEQRERRRLASVLHDHLQQFLVAAKMRLSMLANRCKDDTLVTDFRHISESITDAIKAAKDLSVELRPPVLYEDGLAAALGWLKRQMCERHALEVTLTVDEGADPPDDHVRALLFEAVRELLLNVVKHAKVRAVAVSLQRRDSDRLQVVIADRGCGCDLRKLAASDGGFGLFSIRERLAALGGGAEFHSAPGGGFQARLTVPMLESADPAVGRQAPESPAGGASRSRAARRKSATITVVLADDHEIVREGIAGMLDDTRDIQVVGHAENGEEAVQLVQEHQPDVVVLDVNMPRMNGMEAARIIRKRWPHIGIIGLSVQDDQASAASMIAAGANRYLVKGCAAAELIAAVRTLTSSAGGPARPVTPLVRLNAPPAPRHPPARRG